MTVIDWRSPGSARPANGRLRRNLAVAARSNDGPFTIPFADLAHRWTTEPRGRTTTPLPGDAFGIGGFSRAHSSSLRLLG
jgi:hypothetical protein